MTRAALAPLGLLLAYGVAFAAAALGAGPIVFDDHPGQLYRVWHVVAHGVAPWRWNEGWWTGYPELQFYPPGFAYAAAFLHAAALGRLPVEAAYQTLVWVTYLAPGITTYVLLLRLVGNGWLALPGAFVALTLAVGPASGVEGGVHIGMVAARLGWALLPLVGLVLHRFTEVGGRAPILAAPLLAVLVLTHPAHAPTAVALLALAALGGAGRRRARISEAAITLLLAAVLTAFWTVPLVARLAETRALAWGSLEEPLRALIRHPLLAVLVALAALAPRLARSRAERTLGHLPWLMIAVVAVDGAVLEPLGIRWLPADRVADGAWLAIVLAAGLAAARGIDASAQRLRRAAPLLALGAVGVAAALSLTGQTLALWPRPTQWPALGATVHGLRLDALWSALSRTPEGRVLFVRSGVPLVYGTEWWRPHTHLTALTPLRSGRAIVNGTFTHPSPVAAFVYRGAADRGAIAELVEKLDGRSLFGRPLGSLDAETFNRYADRLRVSAVVAIDDDAPHLPALEQNGRFTRVRSSPPFLLWVRQAPSALPSRLAPGRWRVRAEGGSGQWVPAGLAYYPLWAAFDDGAPLETRCGALGDLEVRLARPNPTIELRYAPGGAEIAGVALSAFGIAACVGLAWRQRRAS